MAIPSAAVCFSLFFFNVSSTLTPSPSTMTLFPRRLAMDHLASDRFFVLTFPFSRAFFSFEHLAPTLQAKFSLCVSIPYQLYRLYLFSTPFSFRTFQRRFSLLASSPLPQKTYDPSSKPFQSFLARIFSAPFFFNLFGQLCPFFQEGSPSESEVQSIF